LGGVEQALAAPAAGVTAAAAGWAAADVVEAGLAGEIAARAVRPGRCGAVSGARGITAAETRGPMPSRHRANAVEQQRAPDHAGRRRGGGAEEGAARSHRLRCAGLWLHAGAVAARSSHWRIGWSHRGDGARPRRFPLAPYGIAHVVEEAGRARWLGADPGLEFVDAGIRALERLVLHQ